MLALGFRRHAISVTRTNIQLAGGLGVEWDTEGEVPKAPGLYAFTVQRNREETLRLMYVGMTEHLWMVTKGRLPLSGGARGGQRYGRPIHAGATRKRVNVEIARELLLGSTICHWLAPMLNDPHPATAHRAVLLTRESDLIEQWKLRVVGWNRS